MEQDRMLKLASTSRRVVTRSRGNNNKKAVTMSFPLAWSFGGGGGRCDHGLMQKGEVWVWMNSEQGRQDF